MNDQTDDTTQVSPTPEPAPQPAAAAEQPAAAGSGSKLPNWSLSRWRTIAVTTSSLFLVSLVLLGWQVADGNDGPGHHKFNAHGGPPGMQHGGGNFRGGPPQMGDQGFQDGQRPQGGQQSQSTPDETPSN